MKAPGATAVQHRRGGEVIAGAIFTGIRFCIAVLRHRHEIGFVLIRLGDAANKRQTKLVAEPKRGFLCAESHRRRSNKRQTKLVAEPQRGFLISEHPSLNSTTQTNPPFFCT
jgi:hypothetical protein